MNYGFMPNNGFYYMIGMVLVYAEMPIKENIVSLAGSILALIILTGTNTRTNFEQYR